MSPDFTNGPLATLWRRAAALIGRGGRPLTAHEIALAQRVYGDAIDYARVRIFAEPFAWFQMRNSGMSPNGCIYCADIYQADFAACRPQLQALFIHELAHVYQYQLKILHPVVAAAREQLRHGFHYMRCYAYQLEAGRDLLDYGIEQQAVIIEDYARVAVLGIQRKPRGNCAALESAEAFDLLKRTLARFLADPHYPRQPRWRLRHLLGLRYSNVLPVGYWW